MSRKYGLQLRGAKPLPKPAAKAAVPSVFNNDDDDDSVEREIARQAAKQRSIREAEKQQQQALEQDPNAFDYDGVYDNMKSSQARPAQPVKREARYIPRLLEKAKVREREHDIIYEKQLAKERAKEDHLYGDKEKFVTSAYKRKLAEQEKWLAEERMRELRETAEEVTKRDDLSDFYRNLTRNVAFGGGERRSRRGDEDVDEAAPETAAPSSSRKTNELGSVPDAPSESLRPVFKGSVRDEVVLHTQDSEQHQQQHQQQQPQQHQQQQEQEEEVKEQQQEQKRQQESAEESRKRKEEEARQRYLARKKPKPVA